MEHIHLHMGGHDSTMTKTFHVPTWEASIELREGTPHAGQVSKTLAKAS